MLFRSAVRAPVLPAVIPLQSFVVLGQNGDEFRGVPIPLSFRSILLAWARAFLVVVALISGIAALVNSQDRDWTHWGYPAGSSASICRMVLFNVGWTRSGANSARGCRTNRRSCMRGWGSLRWGSSRTASP